MENGSSEERPESRSNSSLLAAGLAIVLATAAFFSGLHIGSNVTAQASNQASIFSLFSSHTNEKNEVNLDEFWQVWNLLDDKFVATASSSNKDEQEKIYGAISGLVASYGDPYTVFFSPEAASQFQEDISGNFSGVGMEVGVRDDLITVIAPLPDTPAEKAGIVAGDAIVRIDGHSTEKMTVDEAVKLIRGEKGTVVTLTIYREGATELMDKKITRDTINIPTIETSQHGNVFVIQLYSFNALAEAKMQDALREYVKSGADELILDLRGNPGGFLQSAVAIASYFLPAGDVVVRENFGEDKKEDIHRSTGRSLGEYKPKKMVVLVDQGSASAAEILAGALQEHQAATLIGETTFGKGSVQELVDLPDGSSLKVTIARWLTPNGRSISEGGLDPDITVERTPQQVLDGEDPQMQAALEYLK